MSDGRRLTVPATSRKTTLDSGRHDNTPIVQLPAQGTRIDKFGWETTPYVYCFSTLSLKLHY